MKVYEGGSRGTMKVAAEARSFGTQKEQLGNARSDMKVKHSLESMPLAIATIKLPMSIFLGVAMSEAYKPE